MRNHANTTKKKPKTIPAQPQTRISKNEEINKTLKSAWCCQRKILKLKKLLNHKLTIIDRTSDEINLDSILVSIYFFKENK
jgi:hypothetical protein